MHYLPLAVSVIMGPQDASISPDQGIRNVVVAIERRDKPAAIRGADEEGLEFHSMAGAMTSLDELLVELLSIEPWFAWAAWVCSPLMLTTPGSEVGLATASGGTACCAVFSGGGVDES